MENAHTPGPWHIGMKPGPIIYGPLGEQVVDCRQGFIGIGENAGNARLIASAPELLAALELIHANAAESAEWIRARIAPVIAKANGG